MIEMRVIRKIVQTPPIDRVEFSLGLKEFRVLLAILSRVGGDPAGPRNVAAQISFLAAGHDIHYDLTKYLRAVQCSKGSVYMSDEWPKE